ncbi:MAG: hypothetical protein Q8R55_01140 [Candidatus Taylorbacteria bacterium]|nr:hypothetical protein [Candidatus Taylorbacteria bacterium]
MTKIFKKTAIVFLFLIIAGASSHLLFTQSYLGNDQSSQSSLPALITADVTATLQPTDHSNQEKDGFKTFTFDNFHGSTDISDKFEFQYPANWHNEGQYFSPQKIQFYNMFTVKAPIHFDLVLAEIFHLTELQYQIDNSKRRNPDTTGQIDGRDFKRYDLIDYGSYGGDSAGRVKIFVGPAIKIDGDDYLLVFHWEEKPLAEYVAGNNIEVFDNMLLTLKFFK